MLCEGGWLAEWLDTLRTCHLEGGREALTSPGPSGNSSSGRSSGWASSVTGSGSPGWMAVGIGGFGGAGSSATGAAGVAGRLTGDDVPVVVAVAAAEAAAAAAAAAAALFLLPPSARAAPRAGSFLLFSMAGLPLDGPGGSRGSRTAREGRAAAARRAHLTAGGRDQEAPLWAERDQKSKEGAGRREAPGGKSRKARLQKNAEKINKAALTGAAGAQAAEAAG